MNETSLKVIPAARRKYQARIKTVTKSNTFILTKSGNEITHNSNEKFQTLKNGCCFFFFFYICIMLGITKNSFPS